MSSTSGEEVPRISSGEESKDNSNNQPSPLEKYLTDNNLQEYVRPHQKDAIEWMYDRCLNRKGALLGDTMGLGKTLDICLLLQITLPRIALLVCTTTCMYDQWGVNLCKFSTYFQVYVLKSNKVQRIFIDENGLIESDWYTIQQFLMIPGDHKVIISNTYNIVPFPGVADRPGMKGSKYEVNVPLDVYDPELTPLNELVFDMVIVDEIHCLRNGINTRLDPGEKRDKMLRYHRMMRLRMTPNFGIRIGLTGTPIQNRISDIVSIITFLGGTFSSRCSDEEVKKMIKEYMFRRVADDLHPALRSLIVYPEVPPEEIIKDVIYESQAEADVYRIVAGALVGSTIPGAHLNPYSRVQYCKNPLVRCNRECYLSADINMFIKIHNDKYGPSGIWLPYWYGTQSKMNMIANDIAGLAMENTSFLCFIHFYAEMNAVLAKMAEVGTAMGMGPTMGYRIFEMTGDVDPKDRYFVLREMKKLKKEGIRYLCFCTIQTCSDGLNMQETDTCMFTTSDWNPANEDQAIARIYRPGQLGRVKVYRYIHRYIVNAESTRHIDLKKIGKQEIKRQKFEEYISNTENAAHSWPVREMEGFEGEKSVSFRNYNEFINRDYGDEDEEEYQPPTVMGFEQLDSMRDRNQQQPRSRQQPSGNELVSMIDNFYRQASISGSNTGGVVVNGNVSQTPSIQGMTLSTEYANPQQMAATNSVYAGPVINRQISSIQAQSYQNPIQPLNRPSTTIVPPTISIPDIIPVVNNQVVNNQSQQSTPIITVPPRQLTAREIAELRAQKFADIGKKN